MQKRTDIAEAIFTLEKLIRPDEMTLAGVPFWELVRIEVFRQICSKHNVEGSITRKSRGNITQKSKAKIFEKGLRPQKRFEYLFLGRPAERRINFESKLWIPETDPVIDLLGQEKCITIERSFIDPPLNDRNIRSQNIEVMTTANNVRKRALVKLMMKALISKAETNQVEALNKAIKKKFNIELNLPRIAYGRVRAFLLAKKNYENLIRRRRPRLIFLSGAYSQAPLISAAQKYGIPVIELQHGVISKYHLGYSFPSGVRRTYKPDYLFLYGPFWRKGISFDIENSSIIDIGSCWQKKIERSYKSSEREKIIVTVSSPENRERIKEIMKYVALKMPRDWLMYIKPHPIEASDAHKYYDTFSKLENVRIIREGHQLLKILGSAAIQVGVSSSALYEGRVLGCKTLIINDNGSEYMNYLVKDGHATLVRSGNDVLKEIESYNQSGSSSHIDSSSIYCRDPEIRLRAAIDQICKREEARLHKSRKSFFF
jgi:hypothetical protein